MVILKTLKQIEGIRKSCRIVAYVLSNLKKEIKPGITTEYLNRLSEELCLEKGGSPAFKGYKGFPFSICSSLNYEIVHGFPNSNPLIEGDIISIDFGVIYKGWYGDAAFTAGVGKISPASQKIISITEQCLYTGIKKAIPNNRLGDIGNAIQTLAETNGFSVVRDFVGHGIGLNLHEEPQVLNYGMENEGLVLRPGLVIAIEPMVLQGSYEAQTADNNWTVITKDKKLSAHFEHTVAIMNDGPEILTLQD
jgi:methionyl aminopeptidase